MNDGDDPRLYTTTYVDTALRYKPPCEVLLPSSDDPGAVDLRLFQVFLDIRGKQQWVHHDRKAFRKNSRYHQYCNFKDQFQILYVSAYCNQGRSVQTTAEQSEIIQSKENEATSMGQKLQESNSKLLNSKESLDADLEKFQ